MSISSWLRRTEERRFRFEVSNKLFYIDDRGEPWLSLFAYLYQIFVRDLQKKNSRSSQDDRLFKEGMLLYCCLSRNRKKYRTSTIFVPENGEISWSSRIQFTSTLYRAQGSKSEMKLSPKIFAVHIAAVLDQPWMLLLGTFSSENEAVLQEHQEGLAMRDPEPLVANLDISTFIDWSCHRSTDVRLNLMRPNLQGTQSQTLLRLSITCCPESLVLTPSMSLSAYTTPDPVLFRPPSPSPSGGAPVVNATTGPDRIPAAKPSSLLIEPTLLPKHVAGVSSDSEHRVTTRSDRVIDEILTEVSTFEDRNRTYAMFDRNMEFGIAERSEDTALPPSAGSYDERYRTLSHSGPLQPPQ